MSFAEIKSELKKLTRAEIEELESMLHELKADAGQDGLHLPEPMDCARGIVTFQPAWDDSEPRIDLPTTSSTLCLMKAKTQFPHEAVLQARQALANRPQQPLEKVLQQANASENWRRKSGSAGGLKKQGA